MNGVGRELRGVMELTVDIRIIYGLEMSFRPDFLNLCETAARLILFS